MIRATHAWLDEAWNETPLALRIAGLFVGGFIGALVADTLGVGSEAFDLGDAIAWTAIDLPFVTAAVVIVCALGSRLVSRD